MTKEDALTWMLTLGKGWVDHVDIHEAFGSPPIGSQEADKLWQDIMTWHDGAYITRRFIHKQPNPHVRRGMLGIEQMKITPKALQLLEEDDRD